METIFYKEDTRELTGKKDTGIGWLVLGLGLGLGMDLGMVSFSSQETREREDPKQRKREENIVISFGFLGLVSKMHI